jgi:hypothetical protein
MHKQDTVTAGHSKSIVIVGGGFAGVTLVQPQIPSSRVILPWVKWIH